MNLKSFKLLGNKLAEFYPTAVLYKKTAQLLLSKPSGFHPGRKCVYRRECREMLGSYQNMIERRREGRILGNKNVSFWTKRRMERLKELAR